MCSSDLYDDENRSGDELAVDAERMHSVRIQGLCVSVRYGSIETFPNAMRKPSDPEAFPEHLRSFLVPVPETRREALFLLVRLSETGEPREDEFAESESFPSTQDFA